VATFPKLKTGAIAQYPSGRKIDYRTAVTRFLDGSEQRFRQTGIATRRWVIQLSQVTSEEIAAIEDFFLSAQGQFGSFSFTDPWDETEYPDCSLESDELSATASADWHWAAQIVIRNNQVQ
jgi:phage-related protein